MLTGAGMASWTAAAALNDSASAGSLFVTLLLLAVPLGLVLRTMLWPARFFLTATVMVSLVFGLTLVLVTFSTPAPPFALGLSVVLLALELASLVLSLMFAFEIADVLGRGPMRPPSQLPSGAESFTPRVCLQVPAYNEPPELLRQTLEALARLDYPDYIVQVVVNNTTDPALWMPVEQDCRRLGPRFRFIHLPTWPGFKAGALNEATRRLDPDVEIVGIVDADYVVHRNFLRECVPALAEPTVAFVQTPQHYRDWRDSAYLRGLFYAYRYFFEVTMVARSRANAIIFGGTMGLIRISALKGIGGWAEWCITEDAEASLRLLANGWKAIYINRVFGEGLMPLDFDGLRRQRFRWAFGGIQILRRHWKLLTGLTGSRLTFAQRYYYLAGALGWFADPLGVGLALFLLCTSPFLALGHPLLLRQLIGILLALPIFLLVAGVLRLGWSVNVACRAPWRDVPLAAMVMFALTLTVTRACVSALVIERGVFLRTPKIRTPSRLASAVLATIPESAMAAACAAVAVPVALFGPRGVGVACAALLVWQVVAWGSAPAANLLAQGIALTPSRLVFKRSPQTTGVRPWRAGAAPRRLLVAVAVAIAIILLTPALVSSPAADSSIEHALAALPSPLQAIVSPTPSRTPSPTGTPQTTTVVRPSTSPPTSPSPAPSTNPIPSPTAHATPSHPTPSPTPRPSVSPTPHA